VPRHRESSCSRCWLLNSPRYAAKIQAMPMQRLSEIFTRPNRARFTPSRSSSDGITYRCVLWRNSARDFHGIRNPPCFQAGPTRPSWRNETRRTTMRSWISTSPASFLPLLPLAGVRIALARVSGRKETVKSNACPSDGSRRRATVGNRRKSRRVAGEQGWEKNLRA